MEVECQREYEGEGAHPNYIGAGVIDGFSEDRAPLKGLAMAMEASPLIVGVWTCARLPLLPLPLRRR